MLRKGDKKIITAWTFYDWANSVYPLIITTAIFPIFYEASTSTRNGDVIVNDLVSLFGRQYKNTEIYSYVIAASFLMVSIISPVLSGIADYTGRKKRFMQFFCILGSLSCASLYFFNSQHLAWGLASILFTSVGFWGSIVFYNAFLPEIVEPEDQDRISARGYAMGYLGSSILMIFLLAMIMNYQSFGFQSEETATRFSFIITAAWWLGFAMIPFLTLPKSEIENSISNNKKIFLKGFMELLGVWRELKESPRLKRYLASFFIYSMGVQTVMLMAVLFAKKEIAGMQNTDLIISVLIIQFIAIGGAYLFSFISGHLGNKSALSIALFIWIGICVGSYFFLYTPTDFYIVAAVVGMVMGGVQSLSRSTYSKFLPETKDHASYFSFYDVTEKIAIVIGMFSFGYIEGVIGNMRASILALIAFFVFGFILLLTVPKKENSN